MESRHRPRHHPPPVTGAGPGGRDDCWSEADTAALIESWGERYLQVNRGILRQRDWEDVAAAVNDVLTVAGKPPRTDAQCKNRIDTLKKKYKVEKGKTKLGQSQWPFFSDLDALLGDAGGGVGTKKPKPSPSIPVGIPQSRALKLISSSHARTKVPVPAPAATVHPSLFTSPRKMSSPESSESSRGNFPQQDYGSDDDLDNTVEENDCYDGEKQAKNELFDVAPGRKRLRNFSSGGNRGANYGGLSGFGKDRDSSCKRGELSNKAGSGYAMDRPFAELAGAIMMFVDVYEKVESSKQQQMMEIDRRWMEFTKELEFQKMKMFMEAQLEIEKLRRPKNVPGTVAKGISASLTADKAERIMSERFV